MYFYKLSLSVRYHEYFGLCLLLIICLTLHDHLLVLVLHRLLHYHFLFLLRPAYVGTPERNSIGNKYKEDHDVHQQPIVQYERPSPTPNRLKEDDLCPHHASDHTHVKEPQNDPELIQ